jgi:hypothetical protein
MGCKSFLGRYGLLVFSIVFCIGMLISTVSPSWVSTDIHYSTRLRTVTEFGPFYSRSRDCTVVGLDEDFEPIEECTDWVDNEIDNDDCKAFSDDEDLIEKVCRQHNTWRVLAILCMLIVGVTSILVAVATCTQCFTCGCCGGSFDWFASIAYWIEVGLSIVAWSFTISTVTTLRGESFQGLLEAEAENIEEVDDVLEGNFLWGFWLFIFSGTFVGSLCAIFAGWAAEGSLASCFTNCVACVFCCKK